MITRESGWAYGLAEVEFTIILPLFLLLALGVVDLGRGLIAYAELEQAAQEGALFGSFAPTDPAEIEGRVRSSADGLVDFTDTAAVLVTVECPDSDEKVVVRVQHTIELITPILAPMLGGSIPLEARSVGTNFTDAACTPSP